MINQGPVRLDESVALCFAIGVDAIALATLAALIGAAIYLADEKI
jgi:hypothetical protein